MARVTAPTEGDYEGGSTIEVLPDYDPIPVQLLSADNVPNAFKADEKRYSLKFETLDDTKTWIFDYTSVKLGETKGGQVAKFRTIINAKHGRDAKSPVKWADDETLEYGLDTDAVEGKLEVGDKFIIRGVKSSYTVKRGDRAGEEAVGFNIKTYHAFDPEVKMTPVATPAPAAAPAAAAPAAVAAPAAPAPAAEAAAPAAATAVADF